MTRQSARRRVTTIALAALAIGISAPAAGARPFDLGGQVPVAPPVQVASPATQSVEQSSNDPTGGDISNVGYVAIGSGAATIALLGAGGTVAATRRRQRRRSAVQSTTITA
ncbi:MAG TPA: hypothetical protein VFJ24_12690 [Gaiellales bacterium]|nr:hypothetical protein [Gaiellales bacterium]